MLTAQIRREIGEFKLVSKRLKESVGYKQE